MINTEKLKQLIEAYKADFSEHFDGERYKWEAVKCFQDNWDIEADDFVTMLKQSFSKTGNLLAASYYYPLRMIWEFAKRVPETVKEMFSDLFDEKRELTERINKFLYSAEYIRNEYDPGTWKNHYQNINTISVYLTLKYPRKYSFYKNNIYKAALELTDFVQPKGFSKIDKLLKYYEICDEVYEIIKSDTELIDILNEELSSDEYNDFSLHMLVQDILYFHVQDKDIITENMETAYLSEILAAFKKSPIATLPMINSIIQERNILPDLKTNPYWKEIVKYVIFKHTINQNYKYKRDENNKELFYIVDNRGENIFWEVVEGVIEFDSNEKDNTEHYEVINEHKKYTKEDFLSQVYITSNQYDTLTALLEHKKNVILQGAPGVGKTFTAKRLAYSIMGEKDDSRIEFIQFHQSYSYEDFIMGYRPADDGSFELKRGVFYRFCDKARNDPDRQYFFIIDEINRGNLSKIFGELLMLIEKDYRSETVTLAYRDEKFSVPENLYIIGMMNTADRSLAMIDYALRRRFSFFEMSPGFDSDGFNAYSLALNNELFNALIAQIKLLNNEIENDNALGKGFCIGHSYFCNLTDWTCTDERLHEIVEYDIIPMLREYWFDDKDKADKWSADMRGIFNDD